jgi:glycosyltransferase involved in cell wall biosynthesis
VPCPSHRYDNPHCDPVKTEERKIFRIFYTGQLYRRDMPDTMLSAMSRILEKHDHVQFVIGGKMGVWPEARLFRQRVESDSVLRKSVKFLGFISDTEYQNQLAQSDAFLLLHDNSWESKACFPTRLGEFLCTKKPVIVSGVGDIPLYLKDREHAYVLNPDDQLNALCEAVHHIIAEPGRALAIGLAGEQKAREVFGEDILGSRLGEFLAGV